MAVAGSYELGAGEHGAGRPGHRIPELAARLSAPTRCERRLVTRDHGSWHRDDRSEIVKPNEIARIGGVERKLVRDRNGRDHQIRDPAAGPAPSPMALH